MGDMRRVITPSRHLGHTTHPSQEPGFFAGLYSRVALAVLEKKVLASSNCCAIFIDSALDATMVERYIQ